VALIEQFFQGIGLEGAFAPQIRGSQRINRGAGLRAFPEKTWAA
jgi:hypothetical protein